MGWRGQRHGSNKNSHSPVLVRKPLCNQFMNYHITSRGVLGIKHFKLRNCAVVAIECSFATVDRGSIWHILFVHSTTRTFLDGFFLYLSQTITIMRGFFTCIDLWTWPISPGSFGHDFAIKLLQCDTSCGVRSTALTVLDEFYPYLA